MTEFIQSIRNDKPPDHLCGEAFLATVSHRFTVSAWIMINMIRYVGCSIPIQLWYLKKEPIHEKLLTIPGVSAHCIEDAINQPRWRYPYDCTMRTAVILASRLRKVFVIGADVYPVIDPTFMFNDFDPMLCWQDHTTGDVWYPEIYGLPPETVNTTYTIQGDLIGLDLSKCWNVVRLTDWFNERSDYYYRYGVADQTQWRAACKLLGVTPVRYSENRVDASLNTIFIHQGPRERQAFIHRTGDKFWTQHPSSVYNLPREKTAHRFYREFFK